MTTITENQARHIVRHFTGEYAATEPAGITWFDQERAVEALTLRLSWYVGRPLSATHIQDVLTTWDELDSLDAGTHEDIRLNAAGTIDNRDLLEERLTEKLDTEVSEVLTLAGWTPSKAVMGWAA